MIFLIKSPRTNMILQKSRKIIILFYKNNDNENKNNDLKTVLISEIS